MEDPVKKKLRRIKRLQENPEKVRAESRAWKLNNPEKVRAEKTRYRNRHRTRLRAKARAKIAKQTLEEHKAFLERRRNSARLRKALAPAKYQELNSRAQKKSRAKTKKKRLNKKLAVLQVQVAQAKQDGRDLIIAAGKLTTPGE